MAKLLSKEIKLAASPLSFIFIAFAFITFAPSYPILVGGFFICHGIFQSFLYGREANDTLYTALLPVAKRDVVRGRFIFCIFIELCGYFLNLIVTLVRMTVLSNAAVYRENPMMSANFAFLGFLLIIFGCFNIMFVRGFYSTAYKFGKPYISFCIAAFVIIFAGEMLHHIPALSILNTVGFEHLGPQVAVLGAGAVIYILLTLLALKGAIKKFEIIDL